MSGPLAGVKILELAGIGPGPFCGMLLADMGADVLRIDRLQAAALGLAPIEPKFDVMSRGRRSLALDLKQPASIEAVLSLVEKADALIEGFRPGVTERLGLGPEACFARNRRLVYGRITGWGQAGPLAQAAGHDINYIALTGALHAIGPGDGAPTPPLNLVGDFGGGGIYLAFGIACALLEARASGQGQVIDAAMTEGASSLMAMFYGRIASGQWLDQRASNGIDGGAPWYGVYETSDKKYISIGSIEKPFYAELLQRLGLDAKALPGQHDRDGWPVLRAAFTAAFKSKTRDEWCKLMEGTDVCFAPVLTIAEASQHAHNRARQTFVEVGGVSQPAPAPRFSRTQGAVARGAPERGEGGAEALADWGFTPSQIQALEAGGALMRVKQ
ncbi:MAG: CaiB/BaiF CoA-transferase family protein [Proteobacteria bacterium]|nr:CaiB/BaiF CoA-transferase family protein [Pseudomonadota bacterium]